MTPDRLQAIERNVLNWRGKSEADVFVLHPAMDEDYYEHLGITVGEIRELVKTAKRLNNQEAIDVTTDWRVGLRVTPKLKSHRHFRKCGVISGIDGDHCFISMQDGFVACGELLDDWMTAEQPKDDERNSHADD